MLFISFTFYYFLIVALFYAVNNICMFMIEFVCVQFNVKNL